MNNEEAAKIKKGLDPEVRQVRDQFNKILRTVRKIHDTAEICFQNNEFDGGKLRDLDDAQLYLEDARNALTAFLKTVAT